MDHFKNPRNVGEMDDADGVGEIGNPTCGDIMKLYIKVNDGKIEDAKFQTFGCGATIATSSMVTELVKGKTLDVFEYIGVLKTLFCPKWPVATILDMNVVFLGSLTKNRIFHWQDFCTRFAHFLYVLRYFVLRLTTAAECK